MSDTLFALLVGIVGMGGALCFVLGWLLYDAYRWLFPIVLKMIRRLRSRP